MANPESAEDYVPMTEMPVHPLADIFPMMSEEELADLAADIKANGLLHPIVRDADGVLIDGRNRLQACSLAGVEPQFVELNGHDAAALIFSANLARRNLTKGQQAMAMAMIYPEPAKLRRKGSGSLETEGPKFSSARLSQARAVLRHSRALAEDVIAARIPFDEALKRVQDSEQSQKALDAKLANLRAKVPDVVALIDDERLTIEAAMAELAQRQRQVLQCIESAQHSIRHFLGLGAHLTIIRAASNLSADELALIDKERDDIDLFAELPDKEIAALTAIISELKRLKGGK